MERILVSDPEILNGLLSQNPYYANGKNSSLEYLYETVAKSRWTLENLHGIYLTKPEYAWMAVWMGITSREAIRKRQIRYVSPKENDFIGGIEVYNPDNMPVDSIISNRSFLYLFDVGTETRRVDLSQADAVPKDMFALTEIERRGEMRQGYKPLFPNPAIVTIDNWQVALVNIPKSYPVREVVLDEALIRNLANRIAFTDQEIGRNYII